MDDSEEDDVLHWFDRGPVRLPYLDLGGAPRPVVVALPGLTDGLMPLSEDRTRRAVAALPTADLPVRLLVLSHRHPAVDATTADLADDVAAFVEEVVGEPVAISGHSMGGMVAQHLAASRPDLVTHLALTATLARPDDAFRHRLLAWDELVRQGRWRAFYADAIVTSYTGSDQLRRRLMLRLGRAPAVPHLAARHHAMTAACLDHDSVDRLAAITCPTLVIAGSEDPLVRLDRARALAAAIPAARLEVFDGYGHGFPEQAPQRTFRAVAGLLGIDTEVST